VANEILSRSFHRKKKKREKKESEGYVRIPALIANFDYIRKKIKSVFIFESAKQGLFSKK